MTRRSNSIHPFCRKTTQAEKGEGERGGKTSVRGRCGDGGVCTEERRKQKDGRGEERGRGVAKLCLRNDVGHKSFVISESGLREEGGVPFR